MRIAWTLTPVLLWGCSLYGPSLSIEIALPALPPHWTARFHQIEAVVRACEGNRSVGLYRGPWKPMVAARVAADGPVAVLATPYCDGLPLRPAGGFISAYPEARRVGLEWEDGVAAMAAERLAEQGVDLAGFNFPRLAADIRKRGPPDPWELDIERIVTRVAEGSFRVTDIRSKQKTMVAVELEPGGWFTESALGVVIETGPFELTWGHHRLFHISSPRALSLAVAVSETVVLER
jgi:hypothetical protein